VGKLRSALRCDLVVSGAFVDVSAANILKVDEN
jgi:hypothetical protein